MIRLAVQVRDNKKALLCGASLSSMHNMEKLFKLRNQVVSNKEINRNFLKERHFLADLKDELGCVRRRKGRFNVVFDGQLIFRQRFS